MFSNPFNLATLDGTNGFVINGIDGYDYSGRSVSSAGDVNGDDIDDMIISANHAAPNGKQDAGESYVVFGSNNPTSSLNLSSLDGTNGYVINGIDKYDYSGRSVSSAGDINDDGIDDIIISAPDAGTAGESYVVFGSNNPTPSLNLANLDGTNGFVISGLSGITDNSGTSLSDAGDVNGDGIDDIIIGASYANPNGKQDAGSSYVVFGRNNPFSNLNLDSINGVNGFTIYGINAGDNSGTSVSDAGDVNGDGIDDIIIGASSGDPNDKTNAGESYVVFGSNNPSASLNLSDLDGTDGFVINGIDAEDRSGSSVSSAGDINNDGIGDIIIGAFLGDPNDKTNAGESYVVFGSNNPSASLNLSDLDGTDGFVINGIDGYDNFGTSVSDAGDINGDGIDDIIISAFLGDPNDKTNAGESYVVFGSRSDFSPSFDLSSLDGTNGFVLDGIDRGDRSGASVSSAGDVNKDGIGDIIISANHADPNSKYSAGESYVVFGVGSESDDVTPELNIITNPAVNILENKTAVIDIDATDNIDTEGSGLTYSIADGDDSALFSINVNTGELSFKNAADFEMPSDTNKDNDYLVNVTVSNSDNLRDIQDFTVAINDINEAPKNINGTNGNDIIQGTSNDEIIHGLGGSDRLLGREGNDTLNGGSGLDFLIGHAGSDLLNGGDDDDTLIAIDGRDTLNGGSGNDRLVGRSSADVLNGGVDNDTLIGGGGRDVLSGHAGNDILRGNGGKDILSGGGGQDLFILAAGEGRDIIQDFKIGVDTIGLADGIDFDDLNFDGRNIIFDSQVLASVKFDTSRFIESDFTTV